MKIAPQNRTLFLDALREWCETYNITLFQVPTEGNGSIHATPKVVALRTLANYDLRGFTDILDDHCPKLTDNEPIKYSRWIFGDSAQNFAVSDSDSMLSKAIDPDAAGNDGLVNKDKLKLRRESALAY